ncbi:Endonuclease/exonuclease/phosphatase family protein [hydrothermal vent metagenome]|uniref:Endonuclease/exonuclease/phosphatase family protein n=1 Tax=hydrothermal vent metagenome TaxID=652676 RepID=A0A3B0U9K5_9ZZZZ
MKYSIFLLFLLFNCVIITAQDLNIISYNIRFNTPEDGINAWPNRVDMVTGLLQFHDADIFGLQEALRGQLKDIEEKLLQYRWIGVGRDDGGEKGEYCPVFYRSDKFNLLEKGNFWLSGQPNRPGLGWDAACPRLCTWGRFKIIGNSKEFLFFNTHFDHKGDVARGKSAKLILDSIAKIAGGEDLPVILTGDFNLTPDKAPISEIKKVLNDSRDISEEEPYGAYGTYNGFNFGYPLKRRIDYIFVNSRVVVLKYAVLTDSKEQRYPSDHLPVFVKVELK